MKTGFARAKEDFDRSVQLEAFKTVVGIGKYHVLY